MFSVNQKSVSVSALSRGYATVDTYISDESIMDSIRNGTYRTVFICGFYSSSEIKNLGVLKKACDASGTELVIFPAHNESSNVIASATSTYKNLFCLNWKQELDGLIKEGVDRWDLCVDDAHDHSLPLAGYVGAHMIYRALFGELPVQPLSSSIDQNYINSILKDYVTRSVTVNIPKADINYVH